MVHRERAKNNSEHIHQHQKRPHKTLNQISKENKRRNTKSSACLPQCKQENKPNSQTTTLFSLHSPREKKEVVVASERARERRKDAGAHAARRHKKKKLHYRPFLSTRFPFLYTRAHAFLYHWKIVFTRFYLFGGKVKSVAQEENSYVKDSTR